MKTPTSYLIVNMCVIEIIATVTVVGTNTALKITVPDPMPYLGAVFAEMFCKILIFSDGFLHDIVILSMTAISVDRYLAVKFPLRRTITAFRAKIIVLFTWISSLLATGITLYSTRHIKLGNTFICTEVWDPFPVSTVAIILVQIIFFFFVPLIIMTVLYSITVHKLWVRRIPGNVTAANQRLEHKTKMNVLKMCIVVVVVFAVCWLPAFTIRLVQYTIKSTCPLGRDASIVIFLISASSYFINPIVYFIFSKDYRNGFMNILMPLLNLGRRLRPPTTTQGMDTMDLDMKSSAISVICDQNVKAVSMRERRDKGDIAL